ncbi:hypothetical protein [Pseudomonas sp. NPDC096950]|uniref:hypothetical protein n=1 Tax=Pseudomonas sp. NPDC096950 TaxID=3364485 RepID=UPI00383BD336
MKVKEFRGITADMRRLVNDWHACVDQLERESWRERAHRFLALFLSASCCTATPKDLADRLDAYHDYTGLAMQTVLSGSTSKPVSMSLASRYNKSPSRAVRLARAARGAMRRGYF